MRTPCPVSKTIVMTHSACLVPKPMVMTRPQAPLLVMAMLPTKTWRTRRRPVVISSLPLPAIRVASPALCLTSAPHILASNSLSVAAGLIFVMGGTSRAPPPAAFESTCPSPRTGD